MVRIRPQKVDPPSLNSSVTAGTLLLDIDKLYLREAVDNLCVQVPLQTGTPVGGCMTTSGEGSNSPSTPNSVLNVSNNPGPQRGRSRESSKILSRNDCVPLDTDSDSDSDCDWDELDYALSITLRVGDYTPDSDVDCNDNIMDLQYFTKSYKAGMKYARNLAEMLRKGAWYGLVCVELNPGPPKKGKTKSKVHEVVKIVEKKVKPSSSSSSGSVGRKFGGFLGDMAQKAIMTITGMGDYTVKNNSLFNGSVSSNSPPQFVMKNPGSVRCVHREYIGEVISPGPGFAIKSYVINPETPATFPWLSSLALSWEQYKFHGLVFEFKSTSATAVASTNTALGSVILATQYNSLETPFISKLQMDQYEFAIATNPAVSAIHPVECSTAVGAPEFLFTDAGALNSGGDPRFSIMGNFSIATQGQQASSTIGELWVSYDIEFYKPRLDNGTVSTPQDFMAQYTVSVLGTPFAMNTVDIFAVPSGAVFSTGNTSDLAVVLGTQTNGNANTLVFPPSITGTFVITFQLYLTSSTVVKTANNQAMFLINTNTATQPWASSALVLPSFNDAGNIGGPLAARTVSPYVTGQIVSGLTERNAIRITNNISGTKISFTTNFPTALGTTVYLFAVTVQPLWYSNNG